MATMTFNIWRSNDTGGEFKEYQTDITEGMVVLDAVLQIQQEHANDLAVRWNCKAGKCGSCSAEINGRPKLMCMTRMSDMPPDKPVSIQPMKLFLLSETWSPTFPLTSARRRKLKNLSRVYPMLLMAHGEWIRSILTAFRSFANALNVFFARTYVTFCENTTSMKNLLALVTWCISRHWKCIRWM